MKSGRKRLILGETWILGESLETMWKRLMQSERDLIGAKKLDAGISFIQATVALILNAASRIGQGHMNSIG
ncbi:MAG: hypothetical protein LBT59_23290 [Clostridiales bacterium]|nr:hypothetical protein [Clostridiales bacterium]